MIDSASAFEDRSFVHYRPATNNKVTSFLIRITFCYKTRLELYRRQPSGGLPRRMNRSPKKGSK